MRLHPRDIRLSDGRWLRYKGKGAITLPGGPNYTDNAMWKHPEGLLVIATVERESLHVSLSHRSHEVTDRDCTLVADALFPIGSVVEKRGEVAEYTEGTGHSYTGIVHLLTPIDAIEVDKLSQPTRQAIGNLVDKLVDRVLKKNPA